ncbi:MAG: hypothetical protein LBH20_11300 [Treponema sp.]|jgi:hypothetical protein|nr:hypothetical protein [Treponema sp.]
MKKAYLIISVVLLAVFMAGCDNFVKPVDVDAEPVQYAADGTRLATLSIRTSGMGRALTGPMDMAGTTYCEASFQNTSTNAIVRTKWSWAGTGKITIYPGTYNVILFAGRGSDKTLLGVGRVTNVTGGVGAGAVTPPAAVTIDASTTALAFTVEPLLTDVKIGTGSTFVTDSGILTLPGTDQFGNTVPVFPIDKNTGTYTPAIATWSFAVGSLTTSTLVGTYDTDMIIGTGGAKVKSTGFSSEESLDVPQTVTLVYGGPAAGTAVTGSFTFSITPPVNKDGAVLIAIEAPVCAIDNTSATGPITWYIRGGLNNSLVDAGEAPSAQQQGALGGAVIVAFGEVDAIPTIILETPNWP